MISFFFLSFFLSHARQRTRALMRRALLMPLLRAEMYAMMPSANHADAPRHGVTRERD
jgi:hypothetical protein